MLKELQAHVTYLALKSKVLLFWVPIILFTIWSQVLHNKYSKLSFKYGEKFVAVYQFKDVFNTPSSYWAYKD